MNSNLLLRAVLAECVDASDHHSTSIEHLSTLNAEAAGPQMAKVCLRKKVSLGIVICALVLWLFLIIAFFVFNTAADLNENRIWCDTQIPASVQNVTEVFADFEVSCLAQCRLRARQPGIHQ